MSTCLGLTRLSQVLFCPIIRWGRLSIPHAARLAFWGLTSYITQHNILLEWGVAWNQIKSNQIICPKYFSLRVFTVQRNANLWCTLAYFHSVFLTFILIPVLLAAIIVAWRALGARPLNTRRHPNIIRISQIVWDALRSGIRPRMRPPTHQQLGQYVEEIWRA